MRLDRFLQRWEWWREVDLLLLALLIPTTAFLAYLESISLIRLPPTDYCSQYERGLLYCGVSFTERNGSCAGTCTSTRSVQVPLVIAGEAVLLKLTRTMKSTFSKTGYC